MTNHEFLNKLRALLEESRASISCDDCASLHGSMGKEMVIRRNGKEIHTVGFSSSLHSEDLDDFA